MKKLIFCIIKVAIDFVLDPHPDLLVRGTGPMTRIRIRIRTKMSRIRNTVINPSNNYY